MKDGPCGGAWGALSAPDDSVLTIINQDRPQGWMDGWMEKKKEKRKHIEKNKSETEKERENRKLTGLVSRPAGK